MSQISGPATVGPGSGTVTSISAGTGITLTPNPITTTGTVALTIPVAIANGGTNNTAFTTDSSIYFDGTKLNSLGAATNGQLIIGSTGVAPVLTTLTAGTGITITNGAGSITVASSLPTNPVTTLHTQDGNNVTATAGVINLSGGNNLTTTGTAGPNTATISLTGITQHSLQVGGAANALTQLGVATNGQIPIGSTGADPVLATLTAGANVTITNGAGSITIAANSGAETVAYTGINHASSPYTVLATDYYISADVTAGVISVLLPNAPSTGRIFVVKDKVGLSGTSNITITTVGGAVNIDGATTFVMNTNYEAVSVIFNGTSYEIF